EDARGAQWRKLIFNAASNAIAALTGLTHGQIAEPPTRDLAWAVMAEGRAVSDAQGITLDSSPEELFDFAARKEVAYDHKPSMLQDVEAGRETEIDFLNGAVVSFGQRHGVEAPLNGALTALVKGLERSREAWPPRPTSSAATGSYARPPPATVSMRSWSAAPSTRASRAPFATCPASASCTATPTSCSRSRASRRSSSRGRPVGSATIPSPGSRTASSPN